ncbi:RAMP superfamily CRISPR-associated protein [Vibrio sinaloensis]|uniref:CRISPR type III-associated protein domain-containing protein n=1 Tax=Photobacterium sp. (strain ATCC 43367) TaxID=379097 RepID=A0A0A5HXR2_PHOS4|nr:RAMP superfamily CRISPR-associated protein [Vibrio sinaloensis]KGY10357.1 hypothetical protein NM06_05470 [Vibrio sinaloensis]
MTKQYFAITVEATLRVKTPLLIASGEQKRLIEDQQEQLTKGAETRNTLSPCRGCDDSIYLPASSLKGAALAFIKEHEFDQNWEWIFGERAQQIEGITSSQGGNVRFRNATEKQNVVTEIVTRNSIDAITGSAKQGHLFDVEAVKPGSEFVLKLTAPKANENQLTALISLLTAWGYGDNCIGRNSCNSQGQFELDDMRVKGVEESAYKSWLTSGSSAELAQHVSIISLTAKPITRKQSGLMLDLKLIPLSPIFVSNGKTEKGDDGHQITNAQTNSDGQYMIPATSFRGSYRSLGRKILLTLLQQSGQKAEQTANEYLQVLFGGEKQASAVSITDFTASHQETCKQAFIAIDRFTGGVKGGTQSLATAGANYTINKPIVDEYQGKVTLHSKLLEQENYPQLAIFLLVLRDMMQGEILFGGLKGKGFGKAKVKVQLGDHQTVLSNWSEFEAQWQAQNLPKFEQLIAALQQMLIQANSEEAQ